MKKLQLLTLAALFSAFMLSMPVFNAAAAGLPECGECPLYSAWQDAGDMEQAFGGTVKTCAPTKEKADPDAKKDGKRDGKNTRDKRGKKGERQDRQQKKPDGIQHIFARLQKDNPPYLVVLNAQKQKDSPYYKNIRVKIYKHGDSQPVAEIVPGTDSGYSPVIFAGNFEGGRTQQIMLSMQSGGSGAFGYYYIYRFEDGKITTLFDYNEFGKLNTYSAAYRDNYAVEVNCTGQACKGSNFIIDISRKDTSYLEQLYNPDGTLIAPKKGAVSDLNTLMPVFNSQTNSYDILILQRVTGLYNADLLGYVATTQSFSGGAFATVYITLWTLPF